MSITRTTLTRLAPLGFVALAACTSDPDDGVPIPPVESSSASADLTVEPDPSEPEPSDTQQTTASPGSTSPAPDTVAAPTVPPSPPPTEAPTSTATPAPPPTTAVVEFDRMRPGDEGSRVGIVQLKLIVLGYLPEGSDSSVFDDATASAVSRFQSDYSLFVDGVVGPQTNRALTAAAESVNVDG